MREPTEKEKIDLRSYWEMNWQLSAKDALDVLNAAKIGVTDDYMSDGPGYCGTIIVAIYSGGPEMHDVLLYEGDVLHRVRSDREEVADA